MSEANPEPQRPPLPSGVKLAAWCGVGVIVLFFIAAIVVLRIMVAAAYVAVAPPPVTPPAVEDLVGDPVHGKVVYAQKCLSCHTPSGRGMPGQGADLTVSTFIANHTDKELVQFVKTGRPPQSPDSVVYFTSPEVDGIGMKPDGQGAPTPGAATPLTDQERFDVIAYVRKLNKVSKNPS